MRISPLVFWLRDEDVGERYKTTKQVSSITHAHIRSVIACFYYLEFLRKLLETNDITWIYKNLKKDIPEFLESISVDPEEIRMFDRLLKENISQLPESEIKSDGYVVHTLAASI